MFLKAILDQYLPRQLKASVDKHSQKQLNLLSPYIQITFNEFTGERFKRSDVYAAIETYLSSTSAAPARRLKADSLRDSTRPVSLSLDDNEEVADEHADVKRFLLCDKGVVVLWHAHHKEPDLFLPTDERREAFLQPPVPQKAQKLHHRHLPLPCREGREGDRGEEPSPEALHQLRRGVDPRRIREEWHELFPRIERLLGEVEMTPTDVAENLMPRSLAGDAEECLG
ncbi:hypothetical protein SASPL_131665 [Salvia splendens]|uniref:Mitochondrial chaperone BCS1 n=1 Tax=Salvia splendens TaxID=180675 RepID=A0A8X8ZKI1_SALSN|nr:hypothetical protein SASPL_131665 [Salvia splendens]